MKIDRLRYRNRKESRLVCRRVRRISERVDKVKHKGGVDTRYIIVYCHLTLRSFDSYSGNNVQGGISHVPQGRCSQDMIPWKVVERRDNI